jgi:hypothetical protein
MADTANNKQFSVMVNSSGVLKYPQNFITANQLAKFGNDVYGSLLALECPRLWKEETISIAASNVGSNFYGLSFNVHSQQGAIQFIGGSQFIYSADNHWSDENNNRRNTLVIGNSFVHPTYSHATFGNDGFWFDHGNAFEVFLHPNTFDSEGNATSYIGDIKLIAYNNSSDDQISTDSPWGLTIPGHYTRGPITLGDEEFGLSIDKTNGELNIYGIDVSENYKSSYITVSKAGSSINVNATSYVTISSEIIELNPSTLNVYGDSAFHGNSYFYKPIALPQYDEAAGDWTLESAYVYVYKDTNGHRTLVIADDPSTPSQIV